MASLRAKEYEHHPRMGSELFLLLLPLLLSVLLLLQLPLVNAELRSGSNVP
jgi:hypothetical protein